jgi:hypothetical protein
MYLYNKIASEYSLPAFQLNVPISVESFAVVVAASRVVAGVPQVVSVADTNEAVVEVAVSVSDAKKDVAVVAIVVVVVAMEVDGIVALPALVYSTV